VQSYRDLPLLINQWANVVGKWERDFFKNAEFYKKGICSCHKRRAVEESEKMMNVYADFAENFMAIPVRE
jgi:prolyl-tRNA synthetase